MTIDDIYERWFSNPTSKDIIEEASYDDILDLANTLYLNDEDERQVYLLTDEEIIAMNEVDDDEEFDDFVNSTNFQENRTTVDWEQKLKLLRKYPRIIK